MNYDEYYPLPITQKEITDGDNDGMSDEWELARGLDPSTNDAMGDYLGQGYNNIEYYINDLTVDAFPEGVVTVSPETVDLGEDYTITKADADALSISPTTIKEPGNLTLPTKGKNGSDIIWTSSSSAIVIKSNQITAVNRPSTTNAAVTLSASITYGYYTLKRSFAITVSAQPYKFDFGSGSVQDGYAPVNASTIYSPTSGYGFVGTEQSNMTRAPGNIPSGYDNLHADQVQGITKFKAEVPNGKYIVVIHYGSWNENFGTNYTVEGINSGNLAATDATQHIFEVEITDGVLDLTISKGSKSYGGYISGMDVLEAEVTPEPIPAPTPSPTPTPSTTAPPESTPTPIPEGITYSDNLVTVVLDDVDQALLIHSSYEGNRLISVDIVPLEFENGVASVVKIDIKNNDKLMLWDNMNDMNPFTKVYTNF